ncbi:MAG TPA: hypothetical protein VGR56_06485 [Nitrososphaerales archaeon]|nr:hypothetical protein [Nitrososphaerales archaeon]
MKVDALFSDYDGTIAPLGVPRDDSEILGGVEVQLRRICRQVPVCIITSKDFDFVGPRTSFAAGWACVSGLDVRLADGRRFGRGNLIELSGPLELAKSMEKEGAQTEFKRGPAGELLGLTIDWTVAPELGKSMVGNLMKMSDEGFIASYDRASTFADFYAAPPDKGRALNELKRLLGVRGNTMFIGDAPADNDAFQRADVGVGVSHGQSIDGLGCGFIVEQTKLDGFLRSLSDHGMEFSPSLPGVRRKEG